ncbi:hypothetical protein EMMF5_005726 [Cystobasidiomycetes sp. EMM_F5]
MKKFFNKLESKLDSNSNKPGNTSTNAGQRYSAPPGPPPQATGQQQQHSNAGHAPGGPPPGSSTAHARTAPGIEDPFAALRRYDTVFIIDDSESMEMHWDQTRDAVVGVVEKATKYDDDGVDISFFNNPTVVENMRTATQIRSLFNRIDPRKSTPTAKALTRILEPYLQKLEAAHRAKEQGNASIQPIKPMNVVVLTDGAPDRNESPEGVIVNAGKRLDAIRAPPYQLGFSFIQIGQDDEVGKQIAFGYNPSRTDDPVSTMQAQQALQYLDDHLKTEYGIRDMVDTTLFPSEGGHIDSEYLLKGLLGGINRKYDRT